MSRILFALTFLAVGCGGGEPAAPPKTEAPKAEAPKAEAPKPEVVAEAAPAAFDAAGAFKTTCSPCHGEGGAGDGAAAAALNPKPANFNDAEFWASRDRDHIQKVIKLGGAAVGKSALMAPFGGQYNDEQIAALTDYLETSFKPK